MYHYSVSKLMSMCITTCLIDLPKVNKNKKNASEEKKSLVKIERKRSVPHSLSQLFPRPKNLTP